MTDVREMRTARLRLSATVPGDADGLFPIFTDPAGWWYDPPSRHRSLATTAAFAERAAARWPTDGLSYWTARLLSTDEVVGLGGAQRHRSGTWNLSYRIATGQQGRGLAVEMARAGMVAARLVDADTAVIAWVADHNIPSRRVAERAGLVDQGVHTDASDGQLRRAYADRSLADRSQHVRKMSD